jgi:hypothetical protein
MGRIISPESESEVKVLFRMGMKPHAIYKQLEKSENPLGLQTVYRIIKCEGEKRQAASKGLILPPRTRVRKARTPAAIKKVDCLTSKPNPKYQYQLARDVKVSQSSINRIIHQDLKKKTRRKRRVHRLNASHKKNRTTNSRKLYEGHLAGNRSEFVVTLDEAYFFIGDTNGKRSIYYNRHVNDSEPYVHEHKEKFEKKVMVVGAMSGRGVLPLIRVPQNVKINSARYVEDVLKPLLEVEVPKLYPGECDKVFVHHDAASSHTARNTQAYATHLKQNLGITLIQNKEIPVKSPDASPLDFYGFGHLKQALFKRKATTLEGIWKVLVDEWKKVTPETCRKVFNSWKRRLLTISKRHGEHVENTKIIHRRRISL